ncbi:lecithin:cholesterol acyltransferase family protein [Anopheles sinensis]|uniref:Lecithin:cholesterol acyltransferase family protein n=1 Tax=Anopheles sinensis TaxID=74873 RepID=A0A084WE99_ANOSI|nr:lecithin:cholesterol acyltransferase family protein [Anopheles sinensis]
MLEGGHNFIPPDDSFSQPGFRYWQSSSDYSANRVRESSELVRTSSLHGAVSYGSHPVALHLQFAFDKSGLHFHVLERFIGTETGILPGVSFHNGIVLTNDGPYDGSFEDNAGDDVRICAGLV